MDRKFIPVGIGERDHMAYGRLHRSNDEFDVVLLQILDGCVEIFYFEGECWVSDFNGALGVKLSTPS